MQSTVLESIVAKLVNDRHSKQYSVTLEQDDKGLYLVNFAYGSIGSNPKLGTKTPVPLKELSDAKRIFDKLVKEKTGKLCECCGGVYTLATGSVVPAPIQPRIPESGILHPAFIPELLEPISNEQSGRYIVSEHYGLQRKYDGIRLAISHKAGEYGAYNRLGQRIPCPAQAAITLGMIHQDFMLDGEWVGGQYVAFDLLWFGAHDLTGLPFVHRYQMLDAMRGLVKVAPLWVTEDDKTVALMMEVEHRGEGVVFKRLDAEYMPGRRGVNVKLKFWASATLRVCKKDKEDGHHSFAVEACVEGGWVGVGRVTCKGELPAPGSYREVKYLYLGVGNRLYQPEDLGSRVDVTDADCSFTQLKQKQSAERLAE